MTRNRVIIVIWVLFVGGLALDHASPPPDNVSHRDAICSHLTWDATTASYVTVSTMKGGGCK